MQYLLTAEEFQRLSKDAEAYRSIPYTPDDLQQFCTLVADTMLTVIPWGAKPTRPWGCILSKKSEYCDGCPSKEICPHEFKQWSQ